MSLCIVVQAHWLPVMDETIPVYGDCLVLRALWVNDTAQASLSILPGNIKNVGGRSLIWMLIISLGEMEMCDNNKTLQQWCQATSSSWWISRPWGIELRVLRDPSPTLVQTKVVLGGDNVWSSSNYPCGLWGLRRCRTRAAGVQLPRGTVHITQLQGFCLLNEADFSP